jgi:DNA-directed RNA polymerase subunit F
MEIMKEVFITDSEAKKILENRSKEIDLKYEQKNALDILRKFVKIDNKRAEKLVEELKKVPTLREKHIMTIVNFLPEDRDDLRAVLYKDYKMK